MSDEAVDPLDQDTHEIPRSAATRAWWATSDLVHRHRAVAVIALVVVVALVATGVVGTVRLRAGHGTTRPGWARSAADAVRGYLTAVADGHAADALASVASPPDDRTFLTDQVLARSHRLAPLTDITIVGTTKGDDWSSEGASVKTTFRIGGKTQKVTFPVDEVNGYWFVSTVSSVELDIGRLPAWMDDVPLLINGVPLTGGNDDTVLFPGRYQVTSPHPFVQIDRQFTADGQYSGRTIDSPVVHLVPRLSDEGAGRVGEAVRTQLDVCLAQHTIATDCAFAGYIDVGSDGPADPATISWTLVDPGSSADLPQPGPGQEIDSVSTIVVPVTMQVRCTWTTTTGEQESTGPLSPLKHYVADATDPDHIIITFSDR